MSFRIIVYSFVFCWYASAEPVVPKKLSERGDRYFEVAVVVFQQEPEVIERNGRKYRTLYQDVETKEVKPKMRNLNATGFFLFHEGNYYFATAQHVARVLKPSARIGFINSLGDSREFILAKLVRDEKLFVWRHHEKNDVSLLKLNLNPKGEAEVAEIALSSEDLELEAPPRISKLIVSGFPGGLGLRGNKVSHITAVVHLASEEIPLGVKLEGIQVDSAYLINPPAGKGYSGAPIFHPSPDGQVKCIGMLNGAWSDPTGGKFSISVPARWLMDLVDQPTE